MTERKCPIGLDDARELCSAGSCDPCVQARLKWSSEKIERLRKAAEPFCSVDAVHEKPRLINKASDDLTPITMTFTVGQWKLLRAAVYGETAAQSK